MHPHLARGLPYLGLVGLTILSGSLTVQRRSLRAELQEYRHKAEWPHVGLTVPAFETVTVAGHPVRIGDTTEDAFEILFIFNTSCPYCLESLPHWKRLCERLENGQGAVSVYGLSLDPPVETGAYAGEHALEFPLITFPDSRLVQLYRARAVPTTMVLSGDGVVRYAGIGSLARKPEIIDSVLAAIADPEPD